MSLTPPRDSMAREMKVMPTAWQAARWEANFLSSATTRAWPFFSAAPQTVDCCNVEMTVTSKAAGRPFFQQGVDVGRLALGAGD